MASPVSALQTRLSKYTNKGNFPLLSSSEKPLWEMMIAEIEDHQSGKTKAWIDDHPFSAAVYCPGGNNYIDFPDKEFATLVGMAYTALWSKYYQTIKSKDPQIEGWLLRLRAVMKKEGLVESQIVQSQESHTKLADGVNATTLTVIPQATLGWVFGCKPDDAIISGVSEAWKFLKKRVYQDKSGKLGKKPHYVLAHMINDNLNGSGKDPKNLLPLWAAANTQMEKQAETYLKDAVLMGLAAQWKIVCGAQYGLPYVQPTLDQILKNAGAKKLSDLKVGSTEHTQYKIVEYEQYLPVSLTMDATVVDQSGTSHSLVNNEKVENFVPQNIPVI